MSTLERAALLVVIGCASIAVLADLLTGDYRDALHQFLFGWFVFRYMGEHDRADRLARELGRTR